MRVKPRETTYDDESIDPRRAAVGWTLTLVAVVALSVMRPQLAGTIGVMLAIVLMIMLHELGHYVMAKRAGMKVTEFFLGFGPRLWSIRRGETEYGVKAIPAGGYVKIIGMSNLDPVDPADEERTYRAKPYRHRLGVAVAGSAMHFIIATFLLFIVYAAVGVPSLRPVIDRVVEASPAEAAGLAEGDRIVAVNGAAVNEWEEVPQYIQSHGAQPVTFTVERGTERVDIDVTPRLEEAQGGAKIPRIGVAPEEYNDTVPVLSAVSKTVTQMPRFAWATVKALGGIFSPSGLENYTELLRGDGGDEDNRLLSPVGATRVASDAVESGWGAVLMFLFAINIFVGIFNMVPLLPLDGGHVAIATYEKIASLVKGRRVQVDFAKLMPVTAAVLAVLVLMGVTALYLDIINPAGSP